MKLSLPILSIRWKITLLYTGLLTLLMVAFSFFLYFSIENLMVKSLDETLSTRLKLAQASAEQLIQELDQASANSSGDLPYQLAELENLAGPGLFFQICDEQGRVLASSSNLNRRSLPLPHQQSLQPGQILAEQVRVPIDLVSTQALPTDLKEARFELRSFLLVGQNGQVVGLVEGGQSLLSVDQVQDGLIDVLEEGILVALSIAILAGLWLAGRLLLPIARITETARQIGRSGDLSRRIAFSQKPRQDEVGRLALTFNNMLEELEIAFKAQRRFVSDAGHELKTPLTAILGHANLIRRRGKTNPELLDEATTSIIQEAERLRRLTLALLDLARLDEKLSFQQRQEINLTQLAGEVVSELLPLAKAKTVQLECVNKTSSSGEEGLVIVRGERDKLKQVVLNLVDNALAFTPAGGLVKIITGLEEHSGQFRATVGVSDTGCGIDPTHLPHIFERFYRVELSRSRRGEEQSGGSGLGLAIVQEIVHQHGGSVEVQSRLGEGSAFVVWLPLYQPDQN